MWRLLMCFVLIFAIACSESDDNGINADEYYPADSGSYWVYDVKRSEDRGKDSVYTSEKVGLDGFEYDTFKARSPVYGLYTALLSRSFLRSEGSKLYIRGQFELLYTLPVALEVDLEDLLILNPGRDDGALLDEIDRQVVVPYEDHTITLDLNVRSEMLDQSGSLEVNGQQFNDVTASVISITGTGAATGQLDGVPVTIPVLAEQELLRMELYFARDIGVVYSRTIIRAELSNLEVTDLELPELFSEEIIQELETYSIPTP